MRDEPWTSMELVMSGNSQKVIEILCKLVSENDAKPKMFHCQNYIQMLLFYQLKCLTFKTTLILVIHIHFVLFVFVILHTQGYAKVRNPA